MRFEINQRNTTIALFLLVILGTLAYAIGRIVTGIRADVAPLVLAASLLCTIMLFVYLRGWELARYSILVIMVLAIGFILYEPYLTTYPALVITLPSILALVLGRPRIILITALAMHMLLLYRAQWHGIYLSNDILIIYAAEVISLMIARLIMDTAQQRAEVHAQQTQLALANTAQHAEELAQTNMLINEQLTQQQQLLDLVASLETPMVSLANGVMLAPVVGHLSAQRTEALTNRLLETVHQQRVRLMVIDIAGVTVIDTEVAQALLEMINAIRLLGCKVALSGISSDVAITLTNLGIDFAQIQTLRSPQEALIQVN